MTSQAYLRFSRNSLFYNPTVESSLFSFLFKIELCSNTNTNDHPKPGDRHLSLRVSVYGFPCQVHILYTHFIVGRMNNKM